MKIGKSLNLEINKPGADETERYECKIIEKTDELLFVDYPIYTKTRKTTILPVGTKVKVTYVADDQNVYYFSSEITGRKMLNVPALTLTIPEKDEIKKIQRREFVRVPVAVDIAVHHDDPLIEPFTTVTSDLSGGGLAFILPKDFATTFEVGDPLTIWMVLPFENDRFEYLQLKAEIVRINVQENQVSTVSAKFISLPQQQQQTIIQFCFEIMRQARKKELS